ncbi:MAG: hypothetical protein K6347_04160 [Campylobacterales bacterium]
MGSGKKEIILETIIIEYLSNPSPVGSEQLRAKYLTTYSSSTIRKYFKELIDEGLLMQYHASGGRVPTGRALRSYWQKKIGDLTPLSLKGIDEIKEGARSFGISTIIRLLPSSKFKEIVEVPGRYLILVFERGEILLHYDPMVRDFLREFIGLDIWDLRKVVAKAAISEVLGKIDSFLGSEEYRLFIRDALVDMARGREGWFSEFIERLLQRKQMDDLKPGLYFERLVPDGYMGFKRDIRLGKEGGWLFCVGDLAANFGGFIEAIQLKE